MKRVEINAQGNLVGLDKNVIALVVEDSNAKLREIFDPDFGNEYAFKCQAAAVAEMRTGLLGTMQDQFNADLGKSMLDAGLGYDPHNHVGHDIVCECIGVAFKPDIRIGRPITTVDAMAGSMTVDILRAERSRNELLPSK